MSYALSNKSMSIFITNQINMMI